MYMCNILVNKLATDYIAPLLAPSRGSIVGLPTADDFVTYVSNTSRSAGCFLGGAGITELLPIATGTY